MALSILLDYMELIIYWFIICLKANHLDSKWANRII